MTSADAEGTTITITLPQGTHSRQRPEAPVLQAHVAPMIPPPGEEFTMLIQAASIGNITAIRESLTRIEALGQPFTPFVTTLRQLTDAFQLADIREFLASCQNVSA